MEAPDGWYPDPTGRHQLRRWEGGLWLDWVSSGGQVGSDPMPPAPPSGGGTVTTEPVVRAARAGGRWTLSGLNGQLLATALIEEATDAVTVSDASGAGTHQLRRSGAGSTAIVSLHDRTGREIGRYEEVRRAYLGGFRLVGVGALLATLDAQTNDLRRLVLVDPGGRPIGRLADDGEVWTTELAHPLGAPLADMAGLAALAVGLAWV